MHEQPTHVYNLDFLTFLEHELLITIITIIVIATITIAIHQHHYLTPAIDHHHRVLPSSMYESSPPSPSPSSSISIIINHIIHRHFGSSVVAAVPRLPHRYLTMPKRPMAMKTRACRAGRASRSRKKPAPMKKLTEKTLGGAC